MSRGQRRVFESHARQIEQDDRFVNGVPTAESCDNLLHCDVEPNASSDIMIVSDMDLPSKPLSKYIVTSHSLRPESSAGTDPPESGSSGSEREIRAGRQCSHITRTAHWRLSASALLWGMKLVMMKT